MADATSPHLHDEQYIQVLRGIIEGSREYIAALDNDLRLIAFNRAYREEFRKAFRKDIRIGDSLNELLEHLPAQRDELCALWRRAIAGEQFTVVSPFGADEGRQRYYEITFSPLKDWLGRSLGASLTARDITERHNTEQALRRAESEYRGIFENVSEGIFRTSPDGTYLTANDTLARLYGYESSRDLMESVRDIRQQLYVDPARRGEFRRLMSESDVITDFESEIIRKDGSRIWIAENAHAVRDDKGEIQYYEGTVQDISARKRYEKALLESELLYHSLVESLPVNIFRKDREDRFLFANQRFCTTLGRPLEDIVGKTDYDFFPKDLAAKYQADDQRVMQARQPFEAIEDYEAPDGGKRYVHVLKTPLVDHNNEVIGIQGLFWDETERKWAEQALAYERDLLRALLDNVPDRIAFKDTQSRFVRCSRALAQRLGIGSPDEAVGKTDFDFHPREQAEEYFADEQRIVQTGEPLINKVEHQLAPGRPETWASVTKVPIRNTAGVITGLVGLSRDITELKRIEDELQSARDEALGLARQKSQFLAMMSHEIRTPMNGVLGMAELLLDERLGDRSRDFVETIRSSATSLLSIINDILDFSKIEAGKLDLSPVSFDLRDLLETTAELLQARADQKGIELVTEIPDGTPTRVFGDAGRLRQVLTNLVGNAIKFTERGEVVARVFRTGEGRFRFEVNDTGIGVTEEAKGKIFSAFTQADSSTTRRYGGTGLGLSISKQLTELMGGAIGMSSEHGRGSQFWFEVPLVIPQESDTQAAMLFNNLRATLLVSNRAQAAAIEGLLARMGVGSDIVDAVERISAPEDGEPAPDMRRVVIAEPRLCPEDWLELQLKRGTALVALAGQREAGDIRRRNPGVVVLPKPVRKKRLAEALQQALSPEAPKPRAPEASPAAGREAEADPRLSSLRILLAEDNPVNRKVALRQLEKIGLKADTAVNGLEVLQALGGREFDVVLMDCQMPEMDGFQAARRLRQMEAEGGRTRPPVYIIAMTANALAGDREECLGAGMDDYLVKPVESLRLREALLRAAGNRPASGHAPPAAQSQSATAPVLDDAVLDTLGDRTNPAEAAGLRELIGFYLADAAGLLARIETAVASGDHDGARLAAHTLKGSSVNLGARRLAATCHDIEEAAKQAAVQGERDLLPRLRTDWDSARAALEHVISTLPQ